jgi:hypothetical protein
LDDAQAPGERHEGDHGVDVQAQLGEGAACAGEDGNEAVDACDLVEELEERQRGLDGD